MPAVFQTNELVELATRASSNFPANEGLQVVCAWPVSGQYGPGSRILYYVLVAACVLARNIVWLRKACLAAALLLPAVASLHALVLVSLHVNGVVDMDIYGSFQVCSIAILAAPLTVRLSRTYFYDPGRNLIFLWTGLILAGLLALAVEFYRVSPSRCPTPVLGGRRFPYGNETCGLVCSEEKGPSSPLRDGPAANIGVVPIPTVLTFNTGMLLAAACCVPAILSLLFTFDKILEIHWKRRFDIREENEQNVENELIDGTNGATTEHLKGINGSIRRVLSVIEIPLFSGAVLAILVAGEINFFSPQVRWQTEPIASVGQWGPIAGTVMAAIGSLYVLLMKGEREDQTENSSGAFECACQHDLRRQPTVTIQPEGDDLPCQISFDDRGADTYFRRSYESGVTHQTTQTRPRTPADPGGRRKVAEMLQKAGDKLGSVAHNKYDARAYNNSRAREFPEIPGEAQRNPELSELKRQYSQRRDLVLREETSKAASPSASASTFPDFDGSPSPSPLLEQTNFSESPERMPPVDSHSPTRTSFFDPRRGLALARRITLELPSPSSPEFPELERSQVPAQRTTLEVPSSTPSNHTSTDRGRVPVRRATLEVPSPTYQRPAP